jgi:GMP synthase (glutamine-hydrolysing)
MTLRLLIIEGNVRADRDAYRAGYGQTASEAYAATLAELAPDVATDICLAADADEALPSGTPLSDYDGVFITGSSLNVYDGGPAIERQIALARAVFAAGTPMFGSCWGLQLASAAAGGVVARNPRGREIGVARAIHPTLAGMGHPLLAGRATPFDALCSHIDYVATVPSGSKVLAGNAMSEVQAIEIGFEGGLFWGVQYHPEFSLAEISAIVVRRAAALAREGVFATEPDALNFAAGLSELEREPAARDLADRLGLGPDILDPGRRRIELVNFLEREVRPRRARRA